MNEVKFPSHETAALFFPFNCLRPHRPALSCLGDILCGSTNIVCATARRLVVQTNNENHNVMLHKLLEYSKAHIEGRSGRASAAKALLREEWWRFS